MSYSQHSTQKDTAWQIELTCLSVFASVDDASAVTLSKGCSSTCVVVVIVCCSSSSVFTDDFGCSMISSCCSMIVTVGWGWISSTVVVLTSTTCFVGTDS